MAHGSKFSNEIKGKKFVMISQWSPNYTRYLCSISIGAKVFISLKSVSQFKSINILFNQIKSRLKLYIFHREELEASSMIMVKYLKKLDVSH